MEPAFRLGRLVGSTKEPREPNSLDEDGQEDRLAVLQDGE
jgi:hypothetical protein